MSETAILYKAVEELMAEVRQLRRRLEQLEHVEAVGGGPISTVNVAGLAPTDAELDGAFGVPVDISRGMLKWVNDNGAETTVWGAVPVGGSWFYWLLTKAT